MRCTILSILIWTISALAQTANTPIPSPTTASAITAQISHTTPVASPTPIEILPTTSENSALESSTSPPTTTTTTQENTQILDITFTAPQTSLPTSITSLATDTRESTATNLESSSSSSPSDDSSGAATTSQEQTEPSERTTTSVGGVSATETESTASSGNIQNGAKGVRVGGDVAASACALVIAIAALTWGFADLD